MRCYPVEYQFLKYKPSVALAAGVAEQPAVFVR